jgi:hypothetical protein
LAWIYLIGGAGLGMSLGDMTSLSLFPHRAGAAPPMDMMDMPGMDMPGMAMEAPMVMSGAASPWSPGYVLLIVAMWQVMMIAMMTPSAAPMILLHSRVARHAQAKGQAVNAGLMASALFVAGYLLVWLLFSAGATALQWAAQKAGVLSAMSMSSAARWFSASLLIAAGLYQWTPLKHACLSNCRAPAAFLSRHWRPRPGGAVAPRRSSRRLLRRVLLGADGAAPHRRRHEPGLDCGAGARGAGGKSRTGRRAPVAHRRRAPCALGNRDSRCSVEHVMFN